MTATATFRTWLNKAHDKSKLTYGELSAKSGISTGAIHGIKHGEGSPSLDTAEKIARALGTTLEAAVRVRKQPTRPPVSTGAAFHADPGTVPVINGHGADLSTKYNGDA